MKTSSNDFLGTLCYGMTRTGDELLSKVIISIIFKSVNIKADDKYIINRCLTFNVMKLTSSMLY